MEQQSLDFTAKQGARNTDPPTSVIAAKKATNTASKGRLAVLRHLMERPQTDFELADATGWIQQSIGKRRGECRDAGWVEAALDGRGEVATRKNQRGSPAIIWQITAAGREFYRNHESARSAG